MRCKHSNVFSWHLLIGLKFNQEESVIVKRMKEKERADRDIREKQFNVRFWGHGRQVQAISSSKILSIYLRQTQAFNLANTFDINFKVKRKRITWWMLCAMYHLAVVYYIKTERQWVYFSERGDIKSRFIPAFFVCKRKSVGSYLLHGSKERFFP